MTASRYSFDPMQDDNTLFEYADFMQDYNINPEGIKKFAYLLKNNEVTGLHCFLKNFQPK